MFFNLCILNYEKKIALYIEAFSLIDDANKIILKEKDDSKTSDGEKDIYN
jgi:hypothetical protein